MTFTKRTSAQTVPVCVRVLTAPPTLYIKSRCGLNRVPMQRVALSLSYIKGEDIDEWCHGYADTLAEEVYTNGTDPNDESLWDVVLAFICRF